ncbi:hypothetical protein COW94_04515 [Candidatus Peregrinibacteria bacterium CG22_combo_CG10-13_8_21_14_all_44_10]|nr:MAG: excinuclease ABC subunit C [Candidatus Peregrinibacteria bacterium CG2_30_44_17]PIP65911.1 MAG: hypothetical protein COW94_04515 [Candidatus Peregrinibacteria bacterium CG22_combo_CG10-13_8_21_14_all_44_10]PIS04425.1 MAG: hypothetical protein COT83_00620 [Candidatus Peregrinibacteria bacterium CG10_big_fil_rev_8_21_14_0_10_44_7]PIX79761.1 MAG: hypothetical protein COZ35_02740 [Candidatus Peregrinibacteria bacterium CG_4_10_14_3_um_filter_44_21]PJB88363.1 MAG: hypothetical protein CO082_
MLPETQKKIQRIIKKLPGRPGIYKMIGKDGAVLYVGKAKDLKKRVQTYFRDSADLTVRISKMISRVWNVEYITVDSELESLILESNLVKELKPRYNVMLKDDKNFVYIKVSDEDFPRIKIVRQVEKDNAKYYGPKTSAKKVCKTVEVLRSLFPIRDCDLGIRHIRDDAMNGSEVDVFKKTIPYPCLQYHIKTCSAPCVGAVSKEDYAEMSTEICRFLDGKSNGLMATLRNDMEIAVSEKRFEDAAGIRDKIQSIESVLERQKISESDDVNQDVIGYYLGVSEVFINLFVIRSGKLIDNENFVLSVPDVSDYDLPEVFAGFLRDYYEKSTFLPDSVLLPFAIDEEQLLSAMLGFKIFCPKKGEKHKLLAMSNRNAEHYYKQMLVKWESDKAYDPAKALIELANVLGIKKKIVRIEGYDISHNSGEFTVGAMVAFDKGEPKNSDYRHFKIKTVDGIDDYASLSEVITRRLRYLFADIPEGIIVRRGLKKNIPEIEKIIKAEQLYGGDLIMRNTVIVEKKEQIVGIGRLRSQTKDQDTIHSLWVSPKMRGNGVGHVILRELISRSKAKRIYIGCYMKNAPFYEKFGFRHVKKAPSFMNKTMDHCDGDCEVAGVFVYEKSKDASFGKMPDILLLDGGKGQLSTVAKVLVHFDVSIPIVAMDKSGEKLWILQGGKVALSTLASDSQPFYLLKRVIDEAHRFSNKLREDLQIKKLTQ